jgi:hypothetical protein
MKSNTTDNSSNNDRWKVWTGGSGGSTISTDGTVVTPAADTWTTTYSPWQEEAEKDKKIAALEKYAKCQEIVIADLEERLSALEKKINTKSRKKVDVAKA